MAVSVDAHPAFRPRRKIAPWIFKLETPYRRRLPWTGYEFRADWLSIDAEGWLEIPAGYVWDGCSYKRSLFDLVVLGTPDGIVDVDTGKPLTYYASLAHDALYQYYGYHGIPRRDIDRLFLDMMRESRFAPAGLYYGAVRLFGGLALGRRAVVRVDGREYWRDWLAARE